MIHYSFDLTFNDVDVAFVLGSFRFGLGLGLRGWRLGLGLDCSWATRGPRAPPQLNFFNMLLRI